MSNEQSAADPLQLFAELSHRFKLELGPMETAFLHAVRFQDFVKKSWVKAEDWQKLAVLGLRLTVGPIQKDIVMDSQIVAEPKDNPMHLSFI